MIGVCAEIGQNRIRGGWGVKKTQKNIGHYLLDVLWCQPIKLIQVVSTSDFHEY